MRQGPIAFINVEERKLEFAKQIIWHTPTVVNLERIPLYTHQRTWVDLTQQEIDELDEQSPSLHDFVKNLMSKIKEKNT